ncbi:MAG: hypothetical protein E6Q99_01230, partial [Elusimicrobia bacterium]
MRTPFHHLSFPLLVSAAFVACVPARKYEESETRVRTMQGEVDAANARARDAASAFEEIKARDAENTKRVDELRRDTTVLGTSLRQMTVQYDKINELNNELLDKYNKLLAGDRSENR